MQNCRKNQGSTASENAQQDAGEDSRSECQNTRFDGSGSHLILGHEKVVSVLWVWVGGCSGGGLGEVGAGLHLIFHNVGGWMQWRWIVSVGQG